jgi:hypothetical protein
MTFSLPMAELTQSCVDASLKGVPIEDSIKKTALQSLAVLLEPAVSAERNLPYAAYSRLTPTGFPVEVSFGDPSNELRFVTEIGGSFSLAEQRLALSAERFHALGHVVNPSLLAWCEELQKGQKLKFGALASIQVSDSTQDFKLYVEIPPEAQAVAMQEFNPHGDIANLLTEGGARLTMLGLPDDDEVEFYFDLNGMRLDELPSLYEALGVSGGYDAVIKALEAVCGCYQNRAINSRKNVLCLKRSNCDDWVMTLFCQADDLFSSGAQTRKALLDAAPLIDCDLSGYEAFSLPVAQEVCENRHCMLAFTPRANGKVDLRVGLSPTPPKEACLDIDSAHLVIASEQPRYLEPQASVSAIPAHISSTLFPHL